VGEALNTVRVASIVIIIFVGWVLGSGAKEYRQKRNSENVGEN